MLNARALTMERYFEPVFAPVRLDVAAGELVVVTGANGSGKTTLLRLLAGLASPSAGTVTRSATAIAWVGHRLAVKDDLTVLENLRFARDFDGAGRTPPEAACKRVGLGDARHREARTLSAGQRKRCALARLLVAPAPLWLLDEPYANLDRDGVAMVDALLDDHLDAGGACVMSTHGGLTPAGRAFRTCAL